MCGNVPHIGKDSCPLKNNIALIRDGHLLIDQLCLEIFKQKMILNMAAAENISLMEAKRKILNHYRSHPKVPLNSIVDVHNFLFLSNWRSFADNSFFSPAFSNRFITLTSLPEANSVPT